jgi:two-component system, cell cycle sensor histidine kinase and response regulator CckA
MTTLHVLIIEDSESDAELILRQLKKAHYAVYHERVKTADKMKAALDILAWDVIIADYKLPRFDASAALKLLQKTGLDIPFIVVSDRIGEETAVELIKSGANDFLMKSKLIRLGHVIKREIADAQMRRERQQSEKELRESEERYRSLVEVSPDAIAVYANGRFVYVNPAGVKLIGAHDKSELIGKPVLDIVHPDYKEFVRQRVIEAMEHGKTQPLSEEKFLRLDGTVIDVEVVSVPTTFKGISAVQVVVNDITERKRVEKALCISEERYRTLAEAAQEMIFIVNRSDIVEYANTSAAELFNKRQEEIVGKTRASLFSPEVSSTQEQSLQSIFETGIPRYVESKATYTDKVIWLSTWLVPMRDNAGQVTAVMGIARDITNRKWLEEDKQKLLDRLQETLAQVKTLGGLLPICSMCKKIRDDKGYWQQVEAYIQNHTDATFTHAVCPECFPKLYPDFNSNKSDKKEE